MSGGELELQHYAENRISWLQLLVKNAANGSYYYIKNIFITTDATNYASVEALVVTIT